MSRLFVDRLDAAHRLTEQLKKNPLDETVIIALPRGGVPIAHEIANELNVDWDILNVKKIASLARPELAIGAVVENHEPIWNNEIIISLGIKQSELKPLVAAANDSLNTRSQKWHTSPMGPNVKGKNVIIVDDGIATGFTAQAAVHAARVMGAISVTVAVPVAPPTEKHELEKIADQIIVLFQPSPFLSVGQWYENFDPVTDQTVESLLRRDSHSLIKKELRIGTGSTELPAELSLPKNSKALIIFAHGSGSSRKSPRNCFMARNLNRAGYATLLFDLLTPVEESHRSNVFDIKLLAHRLKVVTNWAAQSKECSHIPMVYFGASTGAPAAIIAAAKNPRVKGVISRGGRVDLAADYLNFFKTPTLLIVGEKDSDVLAHNQRANRQLVNSQLVVVPGATHLFEEPKALDVVVDRVIDWLEQVSLDNARDLSNEIPLTWVFPYGI